MIERYFENIKYVSYLINACFDDLPIEYELSLLKKQWIDRLTINIVEMSMVSSIKPSFNKRMY